MIVPAEENDIYVGGEILIRDDDGYFHPMIVEKVLNLDDRWKGFVASDGCRYGIEGAYKERP